MRQMIYASMVPCVMGPCCCGPSRTSLVTVLQDMQHEAHSGSGETDDEDTLLRKHASDARRQLSLHSPSNYNR